MPGFEPPIEVTNPYAIFSENAFAPDPETGEDPPRKAGHNLGSLMIKQAIANAFGVKGKHTIKMAKGLTNALKNNPATAIMGARLLIQPTKMRKTQPGILDFIPQSLKPNTRSGKGAKIVARSSRSSSPAKTTTNVTTSTPQ